MPNDIASPIPDAGRAHLTSNLHCSACLKTIVGLKDAANFVIVFWDKFDEKTGDPVVRDGIFTEDGRIAILKACTSCGPKIIKLHKRYEFSKMGQLQSLNDGPLKKMLTEIWPRRKSSWKLEIGWEIMLPILQKLKAEKIAKSRMS